MKRNPKTTLAMLSILLFSSLIASSFTVTSSEAADYTAIGVKVGDWAFFSGTTNQTGGAPASYDINFTVTSIDRLNVTGTFAVYVDGTLAVSQIIWGNISTGDHGPLGATAFPWLLMVPNLTKDDPISIGSPYMINDTAIMEAGGRARPYAHINVTIGGGFQEFCIDQATGIVMQVNVLTWNGVNHFYIRWHLISTSLWSPDYTKVGVKVGDWVFFSVKSNQTGLETATSGNLTIVAIDRLNVTFRIIIYSASGPILDQTNFGNLSDGSSGPPGQPPLYWWLIEPDLVKYDPLCARSSLWINETVGMTIFGASRDFNHLHRNFSVLSVLVPGSMDFYWDKATGVVAKADIVLHVFGTVWRLQWNMTSTSLWSPRPTIDQPLDITYTYDRLGHSLTWHPSSNVPHKYMITRNGEEIASADWDGQAVGCSWAELAPGTYSIVCRVNDTIGRSATSTVTVVVNYPPAPTIDQPYDATYTTGSTGNSITWHPSSTWGQSYVLEKDGLHLLGGSWDGVQAITCAVDTVSTGTHVYNCTVWDSLGQRVTSLVTVTISNPPAPTINQPSAITYTFGSTGHSITWHAICQWSTTYQITRNGLTVDSGNWSYVSDLTWNVDGLEVGTYHFNCTVWDSTGRSASSSVTVTVNAAPPPPPPPPPPEFPVSLMLAVGGGIAVVVVLAAIIMLRRRRI